jgi:hypothetical protein
MSNGMAPEAKIIFYDAGVVSAPGAIDVDLDYFLSVPYHNGARVSSNSWGGYIKGSYSDYCAFIDEYLVDNDEMLVLWAAGNYGQASGYESIIDAGTAKNVVTVGSLSNRYTASDELISESTVSFFSSIGPTGDGRLGIDITTPGNYIMSTFSTNSSTQELVKVITLSVFFKCNILVQC